MTVARREDLAFTVLPGRRTADPLRAVSAASSVRVVRLSRSRRRLAHLHPHSEEVVYVRSGSGTVYLDGTRSRVGPGDTVHIPAGVVHATIPDPGDEMELICFFPHPRLEANLEETTIDVMTEERHE